MSERQPLIRPGADNEVWSTDFVFDRIASGRMGGDHLTRILDGICSQRGRPADDCATNA